MGEERRRDPRHEILAQVRTRFGRVTYVLDVGNLSRSGLYVRTGDDSPRWLTQEQGIGRRIELTVFAPGIAELTPLSLSGRIVHVQEDEEGRPSGFGVQLDSPDRATRERLDQLVTWAARDRAHPPPL